MKTIEIDDETYEFLLKNTSRIGEDASSILRRLLRIGSAREAGFDLSSAFTDSPLEVGVLAECLNDPRFKAEREAVGRFLFMLSWLSKKHPKDFKNVLRIRGRTRTYFAESSSALEESGTSVFPQRIPNSPYWVVTNNDTPKKERMLMDVMRILGYSPKEQIQAGGTLEPR